MALSPMKSGEVFSKAAKLKKLIQSPELTFLMEAHNGLSAKIVEEAGFEGIWASGLSVSAALGVRDNNEASWTQVLEVLEFMSDATTVPILVDGDTGYGNFNTMRRVVRKLEQRQIAGVCIEDKLFPKTNSFIRGTAQPLADAEEFAGKIKAGKDAQWDRDFTIVARVEAFIAGWGLEEALRRAEIYRKAGADAILMHSALRNASEILAFKKEWGNRLPVVIVPTKYYSVPTDVFRTHQISTIIWANHNLRSSMTAMQKITQTIFKEQSLTSVEDQIAPVSEVFRIQGENELEEAEKKYLPSNASSTRAIILAASRGVELGDLTAEIPKAMVQVAGKPLLTHIADSYRSVGIKDISVVRGYKKEKVNLSSITYVDNDEFASTQEGFSLFKALKQLEGSCIVSYGDVLFKKYVLGVLMEMEGDFSVVVDANWKESRNKGRAADYVVCSEANSKQAFGRRIHLLDVVSGSDNPSIHGEWMGFLKVSENGARILSQLLKNLSEEEPETLKTISMTGILKRLIQKGHEVQVAYTTGHWLDVDSVDDVVSVSSF